MKFGFRCRWSPEDDSLCRCLIWSQQQRPFPQSLKVMKTFHVAPPAGQHLRTRASLYRTHPVRSDGCVMWASVWNMNEVLRTLSTRGVRGKCPRSQTCWKDFFYFGVSWGKRSPASSWELKPNAPPPPRGGVRQGGGGRGTFVLCLSVLPLMCSVSVTSLCAQL